MKIKTVKIKNFRKYKKEIIIHFSDLNCFVGKNDIGKSTILEALNIFFNGGKGKGYPKIDKEDINKSSFKTDNQEIIISVVFENLPPKIIIDTDNETTLKEEYLLNQDNDLEIIKKYNLKETVFIKANHPTNEKCSELLLKKNKDLKKLISSKTDCDKKKNASMRKAIWNCYKSDLQLQEIEIDANKEDAKKIWGNLKSYLPLYTLFQSDRKNSDGDSEIQDPMKLAVEEIIKNKDLEKSFKSIGTTVKNSLKNVVDKTLEKLKEMNPEIAQSLNPQIPNIEDLKWADVFKNVSITGDDDIPINKRGSGVKRLILLNFFRAEAERKREEKKLPSIIYAIEEPETSQHLDHQKKLIEALKELSSNEETQVILTTHSAEIVKLLGFENLKLIKDNNEGMEINNVKEEKLLYCSLNEVNYLAFENPTEEYHIELYAHIYEANKRGEKYEEGKETIKYIRDNKPNKSESITLTKYIRNQIHHPENKLNDRFTPQDLKKSIDTMREFIESN